jgi:GcrA cell cycle regulator
MSAWSEERIAELRTLWNQGHSAAEIGRRMGGVSRNTILGKAYRLGLSRDDAAKPGGKPGAKQHAKSNSYNHMAARNLVEGRGAFVRPKALPKLRETANCLARLQLDQLGPRHCRWPIGDVGDAGFGFCGEVIHFGPYCEPHRALGTTGETLNAKQYARSLRRFA